MNRHMEPPVGAGRAGAGILLLVWAFVSSLSAQSLTRPGPILTLVSAKSIPGNCLGPQAVYADRDRIYLASSQGKLFVLALDRAADFPGVEVLQPSSFPLTAVRGDERFLYVSGSDGVLTVYRKRRPLELVEQLSLSSF